MRMGMYEVEHLSQIKTLEYDCFATYLVTVVGVNSETLCTS